MSTSLVKRQPNGTVTVAGTNMTPVQLGEVLASSGFFADSRGAAQAAVKVMAGAELGFGPVASMTGIYIVKGRVTLSANLMAAAIKSHPRYNYRVREHSAQACSIDFIEDGEVIGTSTFSIADATAAGLAGSDTWKKHPRNMLFARAMSNGAKWYCPDAFGGGPIYTPDELGAEVDGETGQVVGGAEPEVLPAEVVPEPEPEPELAEDAVKAIVSAYMEAKPSLGGKEKAQEWFRSQLIAAGAADVPEGEVMLSTLRRLTSEQAEQVISACRAATAKAAQS